MWFGCCHRGNIEDPGYGFRQRGDGGYSSYVLGAELDKGITLKRKLTNFTYLWVSTPLPPISNTLRGTLALLPGRGNWIFYCRNIFNIHFWPGLFDAVDIFPSQLLVVMEIFLSRWDVLWLKNTSLENCPFNVVMKAVAIRYHVLANMKRCKPGRGVFNFNVKCLEYIEYIYFSYSCF